MRQLKIRRIAALAMAALTTLAPYSYADSLEHVPADAVVAFKVANLQATSKKVGQLATDFGIANFAPAARDPLTALKQQLGIQKGLKEDGDFCVAVLSTKATGLSDDASVILLVPVSNYAEYLANFNGAKADGDITEVALPGDDPNAPRFIAQWGDYAAMSPTKALLAKPANTLKISALPRKELDRQDFVMYANFGRITPDTLPELENLVDEAFNKIDQDSKVDAKYKPLMKTAFTQVIGVVRNFLDDCDGVTFGLNINEEGMNFTLLSAFKPDSTLGKVAADLKGTDKSLTIGLPTVKYLAYGGYAYKSPAAIQYFDDFARPILDEVKKIEGTEGISKLADQLTAALRANTGSVFGMPAPSEPGKEGILQQITIYHGAGPEMKALASDSATFLKQFIQDMEVPEGQKKPEFTQQLNAKQIEGVSFDTLKFAIPADPNDPAAAQAEQMMMLFYGPEGTTYSYAPLGEKDFIVSLGATDATIGKFIKSSLAKEDNLSKLEHVKVVADQLPKTRLAEYYIALDEIVNTGVATAGQFGVPVQVQLPPELSPIGATLATDGPSFRIDVHVPNSTVQAIISAGIQAFMQMQGGGGGGNL